MLLLWGRSSLHDVRKCHLYPRDNEGYGLYKFCGIHRHAKVCCGRMGLWGFGYQGALVNSVDGCQYAGKPHIFLDRFRSPNPACTILALKYDPSQTPTLNRGIVL